MLRLPALIVRPTWSLFADDQFDEVFYAIASGPRLSRAPDGAAVLSMLKYRSGPDGLRGGIIELQTDLSLRPEESAEALSAARTHLGAVFAGRTAPEPRLAQPLWLDGTASLSFLDPAAGPGGGPAQTQPSLSGNNPAMFQAALSMEGATIQWEALRSGKPSLQAAYRMRAMARIPDGRVHAYARSADVTALWAKAGALPDVRGALVEASAAGVDLLDWPPDGDPRLRDHFIEWGWAWLSPWLPPNGTPPSSDIDAEFTGSAGLPWPFEIAGSLDGLDMAKDEGCFLAVDLSDPIFKQRRLDIRCNADFSQGRIAAVTANVEYGERHHTALFTANEGVDRFVCPLDPALGRTITVRPVVTFAASSKVMHLPEIRTDDESVLMSVDTDGWLTIDLSTAALDWATVRHVEAGLRYEDKEHGVDLVEDVLKLDAVHPSQRYERALYAQQTRPYELRLSYDLGDGLVVDRDWTPTTDRTVLIPPPFDNWMTIRLRVPGAFEGITTYLVDLEADDAVGGKAGTTVQLTPERDTADWRVGIGDTDAGTFRYRVTSVFTDGHSTVDPWTEAQASQSLDIGPAPSAVLDVTVMADLIDFSVVKLVKTTLSNRASTGVTNTRELMFAPGQPTSGSWRLPLSKDDAEAHSGYTVTSTFYMRSGGHRTTPETPGVDPVVVLQLPPA
ncbi:hypothetical protein [Streptomyces sp. NPDC060022]|uniref:hypothetical protein n=1 Tax=Streptomyces sp. NPDC060022 TaxID=3347039 RepID=UPI0036AF9824